MKTLRKVLTVFILGCVLSAVSVASAEDISFFAEVSQNQVPVNSTIRLTLTVTGDQFVDPVQLPPIDGFDVQYVGPATRVSIINGRSSSSRSFNYVLHALREGTFTIPSLSIEVGGKTYSTQTITIEVTGADTLPGGAGGPDLQNRIFVVMGSPKKEVYLNEKIPVTIKMYVSGLTASEISYPEVAHNGFEMDEFPKPQRYEQVIGGVRYNVLDFKTYVYPSRTGVLSLGPAKVSCQILQRTQEAGASPLDRFGGLFDNDDLFSGVFDYYSKTPMTLESTDLQMDVLPWPPEGKPADFTGAVGEYTFEADVSPKEVKVGDPITLRVKISGSRLAGLKPPSLQDGNGLKVYEPIVREENGSKILEQVIIPTSENVTLLPALNFSYFDPEAKQYKTATAGPFPVKVSAGSEDENFKIVGLENRMVPVHEEVIGRDIIFIKEEPGAFIPVGYRVYADARYWGFGILVLGLGLFLFLYYRQRQRLKTDIGYARKLQAPRKARAALKKCENFIRGRNTDDFYNIVFQTLREYIGDRFHRVSGGLTFPEVQSLCRAENVPEPVVEKIRQIFDTCERIRYASVKPDSGGMGRDLQILREIIDYLERHK